MSPLLAPVHMHHPSPAVRLNIPPLGGQQGGIVMLIREAIPLPAPPILRFQRRPPRESWPYALLYTGILSEDGTSGLPAVRMWSLCAKQPCILHQQSYFKHGHGLLRPFLNAPLIGRKGVDDAVLMWQAAVKLVWTIGSSLFDSPLLHHSNVQQ